MIPATSPDLYAILGVSRDATPEEIKAAYRRVSKRAHPDMTGGSVTAFAQVQHAYQVLSDAERRARYDATGDAAEQQPDNSAARIHSFVMGAIDRAIQEHPDIDHRDIVKRAIQLLEADRRDGASANRQLGESRLKFEKIRSRMRFKGDGVDLIDHTLADRVGEIDRSIAGNEATMVQVGEAIERLHGGWDYQVEVRQREWAEVVFDPFA